MLGIAGEPDTVIRRIELLSQNRDPPAILGVAGAQSLDEPVTDHAVADDHDVLV